MTGVFDAFSGAANFRHTLSGRSPSPADHGRDSRDFGFENATPRTASCSSIMGFFERQRRDNMADMVPTFGK